MDIIKDPRSYEKNINYYRSLITIINKDGDCVTTRCRNCPFLIEDYSIRSCLISHYFNPYNNKIHIDNKIYYSAMLLSLYTDAERLTYLIQGEFNGTNT